MYEKIKPDILLLDISMPVMNGLTALKMLKDKYPESRVYNVFSTGTSRNILLKPYSLVRL